MKVWKINFFLNICCQTQSIIIIFFLNMLSAIYNYNLLKISYNVIKNNSITLTNKCKIQIFINNNQNSFKIKIKN